MKFSKKVIEDIKSSKAVSLCTLSAVAMLGMAQVPTVSALDVVIIMDTTGSTGALLPNWKSKIKAQVIDPIKEVNPKARFGLASHLDFPFSPYGVSGEYGYRLESPLSANTTLLLKKLDQLKNGNGGDVKESQFEAIYQANTGLGRDLNGNGLYSDQGDIPPSNMNFDPTTESMTIHFTSPLQFHNDPLEPNYPYSGVVNHPASLIDAQAAMLANNNVYFPIVPVFHSDPLRSAALGGRVPRISTPLITDNEGNPVSLSKFSTDWSLPFSAAPSSAKPLTSAEKLARATGGSVLKVGSDLSQLKDAMKVVVKKARLCDEGSKPVKLPVGVICVREK